MTAEAMTSNPVSVVLQNRHHGRERGIWSCCSANEYVIRAAMRRAKKNNTVALVEATANQVNQNGGYTGMTPDDFHVFLSQLAAKEDFPLSKLLSGGDHLGPLTWRDLPEQDAMRNATELVCSYVKAGFSKIHIDTSMHVADDDPNERLSDKVIARRGAELCYAAETAFAEYRSNNPYAPEPVYVIGSEVPIPGGAQENEASVAVTKPDDFEATITAFKNAFSEKGLYDAWTRIIGVVVQPGVEFADESVIEYNRNLASKLTNTLQKYENLVFEGHSTDYQPKECLKQMVEDGIAILKVGPALTFALREGIFALEYIEQELSTIYTFIPSHFRWTLEQVMIDDPGYWKKYYQGDFKKKCYSRAFSFSDRSRYYLNHPEVKNALKLLIKNLDEREIPLALLSQYLPAQYARVRSGILQPCAEDLLIDRIGDCIDDYLYAVLKKTP